MLFWYILRVFQFKFNYVQIRLPKRGPLRLNPSPCYEYPERNPICFLEPTWWYSIAAGRDKHGSSIKHHHNDYGTIRRWSTFFDLLFLIMNISELSIWFTSSIFYSQQCLKPKVYPHWYCIFKTNRHRGIIILVHIIWYVECIYIL